MSIGLDRFHCIQNYFCRIGRKSCSHIEMLWIHSLFIARTSLVLLICFLIFTILSYICLGADFVTLNMSRSMSPKALWALPGHLLNISSPCKRVTNSAISFSRFSSFFSPVLDLDSSDTLFSYTFLSFFPIPTIWLWRATVFSVRCPAASFTLSVSTKNTCCYS